MFDLDFAKLCNRKDLEFWSKIWPILVAGAYVSGLVLLNVVSYLVWGYTDLGISGTLCGAAVILVALLLLFAWLFGSVTDRLVFDPLVKGLRWAQWTFGVTIGLILVLYLLSYIFQGAIKDYLSHHLFLPHAVPLIVGISMLCVGAFVILGAGINGLRGTISLKDEKPVEPQSLSDRHPWIRFFPLILLGAVCVPFAVVYLLIPARYGGGGPEPVLLWMSPGDLASVDPPSLEKSDPACKSASSIGYKGLNLVHEGADYFVLNPENTNRTILLNKDVIKRYQLVHFTDQEALKLFNDKPSKDPVVCYLVTTLNETKK